MTGIDLHMHSACSNDGELFPAQLIALCCEQQLHTISLTDHNSTRGMAEAIASTHGTDITLIPGIEIDCAYRETDLHLLGYGIRWNDPVFSDLESSVAKKIMDAFPVMVENLGRLGIPVDANRVLAKADGQLPSGELIAEVLLADEEARSNPLLQAYLPGGARGDMPYINFYRDFFAQGMPAYVPIRFMAFSEAVELVTAYGGIPVVAHPGANLAGRETWVNDLLDAGAMGLEVFNNYHDARQTGYFAEVAAGRKRLITCGSDYHGKTKPLIRPGAYRFLREYEIYVNNSLHFINTRGSLPIDGK